MLRTEYGATLKTWELIKIVLEMWEED